MHAEQWQYRMLQLIHFRASLLMFFVCSVWCCIIPHVSSDNVCSSSNVDTVLVCVCVCVLLIVQQTFSATTLFIHLWYFLKKCLNADGEGNAGRKPSLQRHSSTTHQFRHICLFTSAGWIAKAMISLLLCFYSFFWAQEQQSFNFIESNFVESIESAFLTHSFLCTANS